MPKRTAISGDSWEGTYRGDRVEIERDRMRDEWLGAWHYAEGVSLLGGPRKTLPEVLQALACHADWKLWWDPLSRSRYGTHANVSRNVIIKRSDFHVLDPDLGEVDLRDKADQWLKQDAGNHAYAWWEDLSDQEQIDFARDVWLCAHGFRHEKELWEDVAYPGERPLTPAEQQEQRHAAKKKKTKKKKKPEGLASYLYADRPTRVRIPPDPADVEPPRKFGTCRKCHVCVAYDVREGCCTVCGGPLRPNPAGRYIDTPLFRHQLFVPRKEQPWTGKLPRRLRLSESDHNKPHGAFWTSTLGQVGGDVASDWDLWTRNNMPQWTSGEGVVLEVSSDANVKHLRTKQEAEDFLTEYGTPGAIPLATGEAPRREQDYFGDGEWWGLLQVVPDWKRVTAEFDGLHLEGDALSHPAFYGWDAEGTAWFTTKPLSVLETVRLPQDEEENPRPRRDRQRQKNGKLTRAENARLFRRLMRL